MQKLFGIGRNPKTFEFKCADCGEIHRGSPSFGYKRPAEYFFVPEAERDARIKISDDFCRIKPPNDQPDEAWDFYIRTILEIPIHGVDEPLSWGVWVTQSRESFERYMETFAQDQTGDGSFGWLGVWMKYYDRARGNEPTEYLKCNVQWQGVKNGKAQRPLIELQECDHPLYLDQRDGISWDRAIEIARSVMHG